MAMQTGLQQPQVQVQQQTQQQTLQQVPQKGGVKLVDASK